MSPKLDLGIPLPIPVENRECYISPTDCVTGQEMELELL
jgi:hypothetical protein